MHVVLLAALSSHLLLFVLIPHLQRRLLDQPNSRSSHFRPTPRGGGLSFVIIANAASCFAFIFGSPSVIALSPLVALPQALVGFFDDCLNLSSRWRFLAQLFTASLVVALSPLVHGLSVSNDSASWFLFPVFALIVIAVTAVINFTNFMDGLDGLVAGCMAVALTVAAIQLTAPWPIWALVGSLVGFLLWNWSPATVFMGDVGSTFLGSIFALLVLQAPSWLEAFGYVLVATPLFGDACFCVLRRLFAGQPVFQAHRLHLFQRLHQAGWPHAQVSVTYIAATAVLAVALLSGGWPWAFGLAVTELLLGVWLDQRVAVPFAVASKS